MNLFRQKIVHSLIIFSLIIKKRSPSIDVSGNANIWLHLLQKAGTWKYECILKPLYHGGNKESILNCLLSKKI